MALTQKIVFHKIRDFSQKLNATIEFIRQNIKPMGKAVLFILGPMAILNGLLFSQYIDFAFEGMSAQGQINVQNPFNFIFNHAQHGSMDLWRRD